MPDGIKEVSATSEFLNRPLRTLDQVAAAQVELARIRRQSELYASFQKLRDLVRDWSECQQLTAQLSHAEDKRMWDVLRESERF